MDTQSWTLLAVVFYLCVLALLSLYIFASRRSSVFEPVSLFLFFVTLFALPLPVRYCLTTEIEGNVSPYLPEFAPYLAFSLGLTAIALVIFVLTYYSRWAHKLGDRIPLLRDRSVRGTGVGIWTLVGLSALLIYLLTEPLGGVIAFLLLGYNSSAETFGRGYFAVGFPWLVVAMLAMFDRFAVTRCWSDFGWGMALLLINLAFFVMTGNRSMILYLAVALAIFFHLRIRRITLPILLTVALAGFLALNVMGSLRGSNYESLDEFNAKTFASSDAGQDKENLFYTLTIGEFVVPFETLPQMVRTIGVTEMPWFGVSFLRAPVYMIPSFILPDRPLPLSNWYMEKFYGGGFGLNEGRQFFFLSEGYLNFGPLGVLLVAAVWGIGWGALHRWMQRGRERFGTVLIYSLLTAFMFRCIAGDVVSLIVGTTQQSLAAVWLILVVAYVFGGCRNTSTVAHRTQP